MSIDPVIKAVHYKLEQYGCFVKANTAVLARSPGELGEYLAETVTIGLRVTLPVRELSHITWPLNWKEALKDRWAPNWFLRRWPVKLTGLKIEEILKEAHPHEDKVVYRIMPTGLMHEARFNADICPSYYCRERARQSESKEIT